MTVTEIKAVARERGINPGKLKKSDLIKAIQKEEGNAVCFGTEPENCEQLSCLWREDCLKLS